MERRERGKKIMNITLIETNWRWIGSNNMIVEAG